VESGKWVGPAKTAVGGELVAVNDGLVGKPSLANEDPYVAGWMVILKPRDWGTVKPGLTAGTAVAAKYEAKMAADNFAGCAPAAGQGNA
jgi:glycine cleavage system H protein